MPRSRPDNSFTLLAGVPVHYDRFLDPEFGYGTRGRPRRFRAEADFEQKLQDCFEELWKVCPLGKAEVITTAGAFVDKPGAHGKGRAFDLDGIFWENRTFVTLHHYVQDARFYLGIESVLRKHFGIVLNYEYNEAHRDHFHIDDISPVGFFPGHRSRVLYLQMALTYLFGRQVAIDGLVGPETNGAARELLPELGLASPDAIDTDRELHAKLNDVWLELLDRGAATGMAMAAPVEEHSPLELLENVYTVIEDELKGSAARKRIETALTTFVDHEETAAFLDAYRPDA